MQRLEEAEKRRSEEKERRGAQENERVAKEQQGTQKVAARTFTKGFLAELQSSVVQNLQDAGFFYDPLEAEVKNTFIPWLLNEMSGSLDTTAVARQIADDLIGAASARQQMLVNEAASLREAERAAAAELAAVAQAEADAAAKASEEAAVAAEVSSAGEGDGAPEPASDEIN